MYVELHAASAFSFLEAASLPEDLAATAARLDMAAMAIVDKGGVYGAPRFHGEAQRVGIQPHIGAEITVTDGYRYPLLVATRQGYRNLCRLITHIKMCSGKGEGTATLEELAEHAAGLICLTGDERGPLAGALGNGGVPVARQCLIQLTNIFGRSNVYVELQRHFDRQEEVRLPLAQPASYPQTRQAHLLAEETEAAPSSLELHRPCIY